MSPDWWTKLKSHRIDNDTFCCLQTDMGELVRLVTSGWLFEADRPAYFQQRIAPLLRQMLGHLQAVYGSQELPQLDPDALALELSDLSSIVISDVKAALANDPATQDAVEIVFAYPGFKAIRYHRIAHTLFQKGLPLLPRLLSEHAHSLTGIDIHPGARIGPSFFIDHGTGVVIGETAVIGEGVTIYQGVTLGAKKFKRDAQGDLIKGEPRHPIIQDGVTIYAGATVLGRITVGAQSVIGGNVWLTDSVPVGSRVTQQRYMASNFIDGDGI